MAVLTPIPAASVAVPAPEAITAGPSCTLQRSGSHWQLGIEAQELTTAIGQLAERLETNEPDERQQALGELEAALLAEEGNKAALEAKADATCWVIEHLRGQAAYRSTPPGLMPWRNHWCWCSRGCSPPPLASPFRTTSSAPVSPRPIGLIDTQVFHQAPITLRRQRS